MYATVNRLCHVGSSLSLPDSSARRNSLCCKTSNWKVWLLLRWKEQRQKLRTKQNITTDTNRDGDAKRKDSILLSENKLSYQRAWKRVAQIHVKTHTKKRYIAAPSSDLQLQIWNFANTKRNLGRKTRCDVSHTKLAMDNGPSNKETSPDRFSSRILPNLSTIRERRWFNQSQEQAAALYKRRFSVLVERQSFPDHPNPNPNPKAQPNMAENTGRGLSALAPRQQKKT